MHLLWPIVRFLTANALCGILIHAITKSLWDDYFGENPHELPKKPTNKNNWLKFLVGFMERLLYALSILIGAWKWIPFWIGVKVAIRWRSKEPIANYSDNIWLLGTMLSLCSGYLCACAFLLQWRIPFTGN